MSPEQFAELAAQNYQEIPVNPNAPCGFRYTTECLFKACGDKAYLPARVGRVEREVGTILHYRASSG